MADACQTQPPATWLFFELGNGVKINVLGFAHSTRPAKDNVGIDWVSGAVIRQGLPVRVRKTESYL